ncbi:MAG: 6-bladed beta-propeller, partial [Cytophagales bacterium]|nr:6-bladed beta-propeller [Cytophagales bacterium]
SYFADTVIYIPLETTKESYIKFLSQVWVDDSLILINDSQRLLMFSLDGKYIRQIGKRGKGPGEYGMIFNFVVVQDTIYISSTGKKSLLKYALDGNFYKEIYFRDQPVFFNTTHDDRLAWYHRIQGKIYVHNKKLNMADTLQIEHNVSSGRYKYMYGGQFMTYFQKTRSKLLFNNYVSDTIWCINQESKEPAFILGMKEKLLPKEKQIEFYEGDFERWRKAAKPYNMVHLIPFSSLMFIFEKYWSEKEYSAIYIQDRHTKEMVKYKASFVYDDLVGFQKLPNFIFTFSSEYLIAGLYPVEIHKEVDNNYYYLKEKASPLWLNQMKTIDENDNPILVLIKVKEDL